MDNSLFENVKTKSLSLPEQAAEQISKLIMEKHLSSGDKLPNEFELATQLNVGRGTIREAVKLLVARNVLVIRRGKGTYIARHPGEINDPLGFAFYPDQMQLGLDLLEVRIQLEPQIARLAALRGSEANFQKVRDICLLVEQDILNGVDHLAKDIEFHVAIAQCTNNIVVPKLIPVISYSVGLFGYLNGNILRSETIIGHRAITDAICSKDQDAAEKAMWNHLEENRIELEKITSEMKKDSTSDHT